MTNSRIKKITAASDLSEISKLTDEELISRLDELGTDVGPVTSTTRKVYEKKLAKLQSQGPRKHTNKAASTTNTYKTALTSNARQSRYDAESDDSFDDKSFSHQGDDDDQDDDDTDTLHSKLPWRDQARSADFKTDGLRYNKPGSWLTDFHDASSRRSRDDVTDEMSQRSGSDLHRPGRPAGSDLLRPGRPAGSDVTRTITESASRFKSTDYVPSLSRPRAEFDRMWEELRRPGTDLRAPEYPSSDFSDQEDRRRVEKPLRKLEKPTGGLPVWCQLGLLLVFAGLLFVALQLSFDESVLAACKSFWARVSGK